MSKRFVNKKKTRGCYTHRTSKCEDYNKYFCPRRRFFKEVIACFYCAFKKTPPGTKIKVRNSHFGARWVYISLTALILLFFNITTYAATYANFFDIPKDDFSLVLLQYIFGPMNGILRMKTTDLTIMGVVFKAFNSGMLCLAVIVIMYTVVMSIINTAHQGEFLGKKYDSMWVPLRSILGVIVIIPTHSGYSIIQLMLMWTVMQGIGAADHVWTSAYTFMNPNSGNGSGVGKGFLGKPLVLIPDINIYTNFTNNVKKSTICMNSAYKDYGGATSDDATSNPITLSKMFTNVVFPSSQGSSNNNQQQNGQNSTETYNGYNFNCYYPAYIPDKSKSYTPDCAFPYPTDISKSKYGKKPFYDPTNKDPSKQGAAPILIKCGIIKWPSPGNPDAETKYNMTSDLNGIYKKNMQSMFSLLNPAAQNFVFKGTPFPSGTDDLTPTLASTFQQQMAAYQGAEGKNRLNNSDWDTITKKGWIFAGSYYYSIANISSVVGSIGSLSNISSESGSGDSADFAGQNVSGPAIGQQIGSGFANYLLYPIIKTFEAALVGPTEVSGEKGFINKKFNYSPGDVINPIVVIQLMGSRIVDIVEEFFELGLLAVLAFALIAGICPAVNSVSTVFSAVSRFVLVPMMFLLGLLISIGLTMEVYIPMVPFIIFFFAAVGWLIAVIETILAAPLIALGIAHPEGQHELFGRAEPALMLLVNVFIRPTFLIIGLLVAILLASAAVTLLNFTFGIIEGATTGGLGASYGPVQSLLYLCIYVSLVIAIINKSFGLITTLTDAVLRFIGNQHALGAEQGAGEQDVKGSFGGAAGAGGQVHGAASGKAEKGGEEYMGKQSKDREDKQKKDGPGGQVGNSTEMTERGGDNNPPPIE